MPTVRILSLLLFQLFGLAMAATAQNLYHFNTGRIAFVSDAPLELIAAETDAFQFVVDTAAREFAIRIDVRGFEGFNSALQQEHFRENYMEVDRYPHAVFTGKILEPMSLRPDPFTITVKGPLTIHGRATERIIEATCRYGPDGELLVSAEFEVPLSDHDIEIPRIVHQKIAERIHVDFKAELRPKSP